MYGVKEGNKQSNMHVLCLKCARPLSQMCTCCLHHNQQISNSPCKKLPQMYVKKHLHGIKLCGLLDICCILGFLK